MKIEDACKFSAGNRASVAQAVNVGCYFCLRTFAAGEVKEWVDQDNTALCPHCGIDSVLPEVTDTAFLSAAHEHWFSAS